MGLAHRAILGSSALLACLAAGPAAQVAGAEQKERPNAVEVFLGGVTETDTEATGFGLGFEYNRRIARLWTIGAEVIGISTTDVGRLWLVLAVGYFNATRSLILKAGVGLEGSELGGETETEAEFAVRLEQAGTSSSVPGTRSRPRSIST